MGSLSHQGRPQATLLYKDISESAEQPERRNVTGA